jgi:PGF-pre-PGF domain-containing protein
VLISKRKGMRVRRRRTPVRTAKAARSVERHRWRKEIQIKPKVLLIWLAVLIVLAVLAFVLRRFVVQGAIFVWGALGPYALYILLGIAVLILFMIIMVVVRWRKKRSFRSPKEYEAKAVHVEKAKRSEGDGGRALFGLLKRIPSFLWGIIVPLLVIVILIQVIIFIFRRRAFLPLIGSWYRAVAPFGWYILAGIAVLLVLLAVLRRKRGAVFEEEEAVSAVAEGSVSDRSPAAKSGWFRRFIIPILIAIILVQAVIFLFKKRIFIPRLASWYAVLVASWQYVLLGVVLLLLLLIWVHSRRARMTLRDRIVLPTRTHRRGIQFGHVVLLGIFVFILACVVVYLLALGSVYYLVAGAAALILIALLALHQHRSGRWVADLWFGEIPSHADETLLVDNQGLSEVSLRAKVKLVNRALSCRKSHESPSVIAASPRVYEYFELKGVDVDEDSLQSINVTCKVSQRWLLDNNIQENQMVLRLYDGEWKTDIPLKIVEVDESFVYYRTEIPRFGLYAICAKRYEESKPAMESAPSVWPKVIVWLIILSILAYILFPYAKALFHGKAPVEKTAEELKIEELIGRLERNGELPSFSYQIWDQDTVQTVNLAEHFFDPDGGKLTFSVAQPEHVAVEIDYEDGIARLVPEAGWYGVEEIEFKAVDDAGGEIGSGAVMLIVKHVQEPGFFGKIWRAVKAVPGRIKSFFVGYMRYMLYGILILVAIIVLVSNRKRIVDFFLEEDDVEGMKKKGKKRKVRR